MDFHKFNERLAAEARKRRRKALVLRDKGKSWAEIAEALGQPGKPLSRTRAQQLVKLADAERRAEAVAA
jgi:hypothetical protein